MQNYWDDYVRRGKPQLTQTEIDRITGLLPMSGKDGAGHLDAQRSQVQCRLWRNKRFVLGRIFTWSNSTISSFQLWDRIGADATLAVQALGAESIQVADRAEWMLVQGGPGVLPDVRKALINGNAEVRVRAIRIIAWQGDTESLDTLRMIQQTDAIHAALVSWAIEKIKILHPKL